MQFSFKSTKEVTPQAVAQWRPSSLTIALLGITALLIAVAVLQYRWTRELDEEMEERIGGSLQSSMMAWGLDLFGELSTICIALQVGPDSGAHDNWEDYLQRYAEWSRAEVEYKTLPNIYRNPDLVENVFIWETSQKAKGRLVRLRADTGAFESSEVSPDLEPLLGRLQENSSSLPLALRAWKRRDTPAEQESDRDGELSSQDLLRSNAITGWQFDATVPAIVHPIVHRRSNDLPLRKQPRNINDPVDWIVVVLNLDTIQNRILPSLAKRYFDRGSQLEYKVAIITVGQTRHSIYSSDSRFGDESSGTYDSVMNIFGPPAESVEGHFWQAYRNTTIVQEREWHRFSGPVWFPVIQYTSHADAWMLILKHRSGPLVATAIKVRRTNVMAGGLSLAFLAATVCFLVIASQRAQKLAKLQLDFVASISHDLLTPVSALYSTGQNIRDGLIEGKSDLRVHGSIITSEARQLMDLINQILLFVSSENGRNRYVLRPLRVSEVLQCALKNVSVLVDEMKFDIEQHVPDGLPCVVGDLSAISQCLQNLILNAVKYSGQNRWIGVSVGLHEAEDHRDEIRICIQDRGCGIDVSELPHVFDAFYRGPSVMAAQIRGTGLGLTVARRIARAMGGDLTVKSELGVGSVFTLHLPAANELAIVNAIAFHGKPKAADE